MENKFVKTTIKTGQHEAYYFDDFHKLDLIFKDKHEILRFKNFFLLELN